MTKRYNKYFYLSVLLSIFLFLAAYSLFKLEKLRQYQRIEKENIATIREITEENIISPEITNPEDSLKIDAPQAIPEKAYLEVPFICQAPLQTEENWKLHEESCEEAALLQAYLYKTRSNISKEEADEVILDMIEWQKVNLGSHHDLHTEEMQKFIKGYYGIDSEIIYNAKIDDIKKLISENEPVIVPLTSGLLNNPYYPYPGYHMLTVIGYTKDKIITNDNGTRRGANYSYDIDVFEKAMADVGNDILILKLNQ